MLAAVHDMVMRRLVFVVKYVESVNFTPLCSTTEKGKRWCADLAILAIGSSS